MTIPLALAGLPQATRDGHLRAAISGVLELARSRGVRAVAIEDLGFADARATGRETLGRGRRGKRLRRVIVGIPTGRFRDRLTQMAHHLGLWVVAEDPAYTSRWGRQHWLTPLQQKTGTTAVTVHHAAAVVIGRRALGLGARRRAGTLDGDRRITRASNCRPGQPQPGACTAGDHPDPAPAQPRLARRDAATGIGPQPRRLRTVRSHPSAVGGRCRQADASGTVAPADDPPAVVAVDNRIGLVGLGSGCSRAACGGLVRRAPRSRCACRWRSGSPWCRPPRSRGCCRTGRTCPRTARRCPGSAPWRGRPRSRR